MDPYAAAPNQPAPLDPYLAPTPGDPYGAGAASPIYPDPYPPLVAEPAVPAAPPAAVTAPPGSRIAEAPPKSIPPTIVRPTPEPQKSAEVVLKRSEFLRAVDDFESLGRDVEITSSAGGFSLKRVTAGSYVHRLGFRGGDVLSEAMGTKIRTLDDAARVYGRLSSATVIDVVVLRGGKPVTLKFRLQ